MPRCAWCEHVKPATAFKQSEAGRLREICSECEGLPLVYCGFCGLPVHEGRFYKISDRLHECMDCHEQTLAIIKKNRVIRLIAKLKLLTIQTNRMSEHLIGNLHERLFRTMDGLEARTMTIETAAQITDVAKAIIESAKVENEFVKLTGTTGSGFIPVTGEVVKDPKQLGPSGKVGR